MSQYEQVFSALASFSVTLNKAIVNVIPKIASTSSSKPLLSSASWPSSLPPISSSYPSSSSLLLPEQVQSEDPRLEWRALQEDMLRQYLVTAQEDLQIKKDLVTVKQQRLSRAQDEWQHLNTTLSHLSTSTSSCESTHPTSRRLQLSLPDGPPPLYTTGLATSACPRGLSTSSSYSHLSISVSAQSREFSTSLYLDLNHTLSILLQIQFRQRYT